MTPTGAPAGGRARREDGPATRVAVVIVNTNEGRFLERSLAALSSQTLQPTRTIVVDNGSTEDRPEGVGQGARVVEVIPLGVNRGFAAANNIGVRAATGCEWVALLNPDAFPEPGWLEALMAATTTDPGCATFASLMLRDDDPAILDGTGDVYHASGVAWRRGQGRLASESAAARTAGEVFSACAGAALYARTAFLEAGGFDEDYFCGYEDVDLGFRLRLAGHRCRYVPEAVVRHVGSPTVGLDSDFSIYHAHRNLVWTYAKGMPWPLVLRYLPHHLVLNALGVAVFCRRGRGRPILAAKRDAVRGLPRMLRKRRRIQRARRADARGLLRQMATGVEAARMIRAVRRGRSSQPSR